MEQNIAVLGLGNPLMRDEGIGTKIIELLSGYQEKYPHVEFIDAGTGGMSVLHLISGRDKAVIIDCAKMQAEPGTLRRFEPEDVQSVKKLSHHSLHEMDILKVIDIAAQTHQRPESVVFFGIEPEVIELGDHLSDTLLAKMDEYIKTILEELKA